MNIYPDIYVKSVLDISFDMIKQKNIKGLILDVDNTLINYYEKMVDGAEEWCENLKNKGIKFFIVSNSHKKEKVRKVAEKLKIPYINFAKKPFKKGFLTASKIMQIEPKNIATVGDQLLTDVLGGNSCNMISILVDPVEKKEMIFTAMKRPIERMMLNKYLKKQKTINNNE